MAQNCALYLDILIVALWSHIYLNTRYELRLTDDYGGHHLVVLWQISSHLLIAVKRNKFIKSNAACYMFRPSPTIF